jgi:HSP20 family protein
MVIRMRDPFETLHAVQRAMESAQRSDWFGTLTTGRGAYPSINAFRHGDDFVLVTELPGVKKEDLSIEVKGDTIRIQGKKTIDYGPEAGSSVHRRERAAGQFDRTLTLPAQIDASKVTAEYRDGVLAVKLPRAESDKARSVAIN